MTLLGSLPKAVRLNWPLEPWLLPDRNRFALALLAPLLCFARDSVPGAVYFELSFSGGGVESCLSRIIVPGIPNQGQLDV